MPEPVRRETQLGLADLVKRLNKVGLRIIDQHPTGRNHRSTWFAIGNPNDQTTITISDNFLDDLPGTREYHDIVDSYAVAVGGRLKCGNPDVFYCRSGVAVQIAIRWPIEPTMSNNVVSTYLLMEVKNIQDEQIANCSIKLGFGFRETAFELVLVAVNSVRKAIDRGLVRFYGLDTSQDFQPIERENSSEASCSQSEVEQFVAGKAYLLGFMAAEGLTEIWAVDPWDAKYLGITTRQLALATRSLQANQLLQPGTNADYPVPTDKLLAEKSAAIKDESGFESQPIVSRLNLPNKEQLLKDMETALKRHPTSAVIMIDVDHFKQVNDLKNHLEGDKCLDRVVTTIGTVIGRKGKIYRWGSGDEFVVFLPDFSTSEALATAERIRCEVENAKPGGDIAITASIGVCATDHADSKPAEEILKVADEAMYESKQSGRNRVTAWSPESVVAKAERQKSFDEERRNQIFGLISQLDQARQAVLRLLLLRDSMTEMVALQTVQQDGHKPGYGAFDKLRRSTNLVRPVPGQAPTTRPTTDQLWEVTPENVPLVRQYFVERQEN